MLIARTVGVGVQYNSIERPGHRSRCAIAPALMLRCCPRLLEWRVSEPGAQWPTRCHRAPTPEARIPGAPTRRQPRSYRL